MSTVHKALSLLDIFSSETPERTLPEVAELTKTDRATTRRYLLALADFGFLEYLSETKKYRLGLAFVVHAARREAHVPVRKVIEPYVVDLSQQTNETVHASWFVGGKLSTICVRESTHATRVHLDHGEVLPFHCTASGISFLSQSDQELVDEVLSSPLERFFEHTIVDPQKIRSMIDEASQTGFAINPSLYEPDLFGIAVPIVGPSQNVLGTMAIAAPESRATEQNQKHWADLLQQVGTQLESKIIGY